MYVHKSEFNVVLRCRFFFLFIDFFFKLKMRIHIRWVQQIDHLLRFLFFFSFNVVLAIELTLTGHLMHALAWAHARDVISYTNVHGRSCRALRSKNPIRKNSHCVRCASSLQTLPGRIKEESTTTTTEPVFMFCCLWILRLPHCDEHGAINIALLRL